MIEKGDIIIIRDFLKESRPEKPNKIFIVIANIDGSYSILSAVTSQTYFNEPIEYGHINFGENRDLFCFPAGYVIGKNGFSFHKDTFIYLSYNINRLNIEKLNSYKIDVKDKIKDNIYNEIIEFLTPAVKGKEKQYLIKI